MGKTTSPDVSVTFKATVGRMWLLYSVDVPRHANRALGGEGEDPVVFTLNGSSPRKTTLALGPAVVIGSTCPASLAARWGPKKGTV